MRFLFVMDPAETMHPAKDTSFAFLRAAGRRGHDCFHCLPRNVSNEARSVRALARPIGVSDAAPHVTLGDEETLELAELDAVFVRKDPPFDGAYLHLTHQLDLVKERVLVVNDPRGIRDANEKLFAFQFSEWMPRSLVTARPADVVAFVEAVGGQAVLKPIDGAGGAGVVVLRSDDRNTRSLADVWTEEGKRLTLVQEYEPAGSRWGQTRHRARRRGDRGYFARSARGRRTGEHSRGRQRPADGAHAARTRARCRRWAATFGARALLRRARSASASGSSR